MSDRINIGDTVDIPGGGERPRWRGEVLGFRGKRDHLARVLCVHRYEPVGDHDVYIGESTVVPVDGLVRSGDTRWPWREHGGCDDFDVTGRARPYHRHAATGEAHAHPNGGEPHTHQTPEQWRAMSEAATAAMASKAATGALVQALPPGDHSLRDQMNAGDAVEIHGDDPVERVAWILRDYRNAYNDPGGPGVDDEDRTWALRVLRAVTAAPWSLVTFVDDNAGLPYRPADLAEIAEEWTP